MYSYTFSAVIHNVHHRIQQVRLHISHVWLTGGRAKSNPAKHETRHAATRSTQLCQSEQQFSRYSSQQHKEEGWLDTAH